MKASYKETISPIPKSDQKASQFNLVERTRKTLTRMVKTMMFQSGLPKSLWVHALETDAFLKNCIFCKGAHPGYSSHQVFAFCHIPKAKRTKLTVNCRIGFLLVYREDVVGCHICFPSEHKKEFVSDGKINDMIKSRDRYEGGYKNKVNKWLQSFDEYIPCYGVVPFALDAADIAKACELGLLRQNVPVQQADSTKEDFGIAYARRDNVGAEYHGSQKAIQLRCKEYAKACGFQSLVQHFSSKGQGGGNAKYVCKKLNGQQFFDQTVANEDISCPFSINVSGCDGFWKISRVNFCHNHIKHVGFSSRPVAEGTVARPIKDKRNTTQNLKDVIDLVQTKMLPLYQGKTDKMVGAAISEFLVGEGIKVSASAISRIKRGIDDVNAIDRLESYQKLESYLKLVAKKNQAQFGGLKRRLMGLLKERAFFPLSEFG
ncbi:Hypothetical protein PHPALM_76 [Phytophthora palmivora]|uniref:Uncharacterized protein n=1 Tax=Phytophthora palmivora TaxID=4796 RepID=A0A2P4YVV8_9STRA|nr:Hypothetical protein PHPALM_76 [Phytophthora palmivora]